MASYGPGWEEAETRAAADLIARALTEDLGQRGDVTSQAVLDPELPADAVLIARQQGVVAGLPIVPMVFDAIGSGLEWKMHVLDGEEVSSRTALATIKGKVAVLLSGERTALNFLQHLSGVATLTRRFVDAVRGLPCRILDTRKTLPGYRILEKYAVRCGGGSNHRMGLHDMVLIKDNHLAALRHHPDPIAVAVARSRDRFGNKLRIEVEAATLDQVTAALNAHPDLILLDNMDLSTMRKAVEIRNRLIPTIQLEASGGVTLTTVRAIAETGVDLISVGALTHSAPALDIALDFRD